jgi:4,5-DOPA dioxygenase extradiol
MKAELQSRKATVLYIPHGGGPLPLLGEPGHKKMVEFLKGIPSQIPLPDSILIISAHWQEEEATITGGSNPDLIYDYYGFPEESYRIKYPAPGQPDLSKNICELLKESGIKSRIDSERGFDHGVFVPLKIMYPDADIPCVQLSLTAGLNPAEHIRLGEALRPLSNENILILGSGFSYHNLQEFFFSRGAKDTGNEAFQKWLADVCTDGKSEENVRRNRLVEWEKAPYARYCHPIEDHLIPLHVCYGMTKHSARLVFFDEVFGKRAVSLLWE